MKIFGNIIKKRIIGIQRIDEKPDYVLNKPYAMVLTLKSLTEKLLLTATNDGTSVDIFFASSSELEEKYGIEYYIRLWPTNPWCKSPQTFI